ncbi:RHS repeat-associated core domain-containing protein, partial [Paenibacillus albidus]|uniref:RHS repeat domain-containing protein n=1 Tax=Paenibacillus albidus TaxID=2041023 RepID=UPI001BE8F148
TKYGYDEAGRLVQVETPGKTTVYAYDAANNRNSMLETYTSNQPSSYINPDTKKAVEYKLKKSQYLYSSSNQLMKLEERIIDAAGKEVLFKAVEYLYDENGNEVSQRTSYTQPHKADMHQTTGGETYGTQEINSLLEKVTQTYDGFNRLKKAIKVRDAERVTVNYKYDGDGLRTQKVVRSSKAGNKAKETNYDYDRQHVVLETDSTGQVTTRYIRGINYIARIDGAKQYAYYLYNGHGDVVQTVTSAGEVQNQYEYDAFGSPTLTIEIYAESIRYGGEFFDAETSLYYLRARYYDPYVGRFISEDSYWGEDNNPLSLNLYTYANNDPVQFLDPTGHWAKGDEKLNVEAQAKIIALTNAYYKAGTRAEREAITAQATQVRTAKDAKKPVVTPLQFQAQEITKIVVQATSKGYADASEWEQALTKVGIQVLPSTRKAEDDKFSKGMNSVTYAMQSTIVIGRTNLTVNSKLTSTTSTSTHKTTNTATVSLQMSYNVTLNERRFLLSTGLDDLEQALYILDSVKANKGKVTAKILKDAGLKGGSVDGVTMAYELSKKGLTIQQAEQMYRDEVTNQRLAEAYSLVGIGLTGVGNKSELKTQSSKQSKVTVVKEAEKPKVSGGTGETKIFSAGGNAELRATRRPAFDNWMENSVEVNGQGFKMNQHAYNSLFKSGRKDIMPDDITAALGTKPTPGNPGSVVYTNPATGTKVYVNPSTKEIVGVQPGSFKD